MELEREIEKITKTAEENAKKIDILTKKIENNIKSINGNKGKIKSNATAIDILHTSEANGKRTFIALIIVLILWFATIGAFLYYINTTGYVETTEVADSNDGGNACVGDNCNNGEINYGKGNQKDKKKSKNRICKEM